MIARDRRIADRRHQDDEVGGQGRSVRLLVAGHRRHARLPDRKRLAAEGLRRRDRHASSGRSRSARCRRRRSCSPTASSTSAPRAASSSSSGRAPTSARGPERGRAAAQHDDSAAAVGGHARADSRRRRRSRAAASSSSRATRSTRSARRRAKAPTGIAVDEPASSRARARRRTCRSSPTELVLKPGQTVKLHARLFDAKGRFLREEPAPRGRSQGLKGTVDRRHVHRRAPIRSSRPGTIKATVGALTGEARARVVRPLPWTETFESYADGAVPPGWVNAVAGQVLGRDARRPEGAAEGARRTRSSSASARSSGRSTGRTTRSRPTCASTTRRRQMARHRHHRAALLAGALRQRAAAEDRAVGAGDAAHRRRCRSPGRPTPGIT